MSSPLADVNSYSAFVYSLRERHRFVSVSTLALIPLGATLAKLEGSLQCGGELRVDVFELVDFVEKRIRTYSYEIYRGHEKICWYDPWEHPEEPSLAATFPHHRHLPPDLREHRAPASGISFHSPNLDVVLDDVQRDWLSVN